jgi:tRNA A37 methylthiotransferase MiaB
MDISYLHVFTYSERDNTEAATMAGVVASMCEPSAVKCYVVCQ